MSLLDLAMNQPHILQHPGDKGGWEIDLEMEFSKSFLKLHLKAAQRGPERWFLNQCVRTWTAITGAPPGVDVQCFSVAQRHRALQVLGLQAHDLGGWPGAQALQGARRRATSLRLWFCAVLTGRHITPLSSLLMSPGQRVTRVHLLLSSAARSQV